LDDVSTPKSKGGEELLRCEAPTVLWTGRGNAQGLNPSSSPRKEDRLEQGFSLPRCAELDNLKQDRLDQMVECLRRRTECQKGVLTLTIGERGGGRGEGEADDALDKLEWEFAEHVTEELLVRSSCLLR
jgi:hypothetical protein